MGLCFKIALVIGLAAGLYVIYEFNSKKEKNMRSAVPTAPVPVKNPYAHMDSIVEPGRIPLRTDVSWSAQDVNPARYGDYTR